LPEPLEIRAHSLLLHVRRSVEMPKEDIDLPGQRREQEPGLPKIMQK
jgi:hypothetical protein